MPTLLDYPGVPWVHNESPSLSWGGETGSKSRKWGGGEEGIGLRAVGEMCYKIKHLQISDFKGLASLQQYCRSTSENTNPLQIWM